MNGELSVAGARRHQWGAGLSSILSTLHLLADEFEFWLLMPYVLTFCFIVGFMAYHVPAPVVADGWVSKPRGGWVI